DLTKTLKLIFTHDALLYIYLIRARVEIYSILPHSFRNRCGRAYVRCVPAKTRCDQEPAGSRPKSRAAVSLCHQTVPLSGENLFPAACARPLLCSAAKPMLPADSTWVGDGNNFL